MGSLTSYRGRGDLAFDSRTNVTEIIYAIATKEKQFRFYSNILLLVFVIVGLRFQLMGKEKCSSIV